MDSFRIILLFPSLSILMEAELLLLGEGYKYRVEPVPTHLTSECGMCISIPESILEVVLAQLNGQAIESSVETRRLN